MEHETCDACNGIGALWPRSTFSDDTRPGPEFVQIERCDMCERYEGDFEAAFALADAVYTAKDRVGRLIVWARGLPEGASHA